MPNGFPTEKRAKLREAERIAMLRLPEVMDRIVTSDIKSALDVGAGTGVYSEALLGCGLDPVYALDVSEVMIGELAQFVPDAKLLQSQSDHIKLADGAVDLTISAFMLHEVSDYVAALREWGRVSSQRVAVIEWPPIEEEQGPPPSRRFSHDQVTTLGWDAGLGNCAIWDVEDWVLYLWELESA